MNNLSKDQLDAIFQTLARCSDRLRVAAKSSTSPRWADEATDLADEARQHCKDAGLLSEPEHSPEPWIARDGEYLIRDTTGNIVVAGMPTWSSTLGRDEIKANAARIVACVNAFAGVATDDLEAVFQIIDTLLDGVRKGITPGDSPTLKHASDTARRILNARDKAQDTS